MNKENNIKMRVDLSALPTGKSEMVDSLLEEYKDTVRLVSRTDDEVVVILPEKSAVFLIDQGCSIKAITLKVPAPEKSNE